MQDIQAGDQVNGTQEPSATAVEISVLIAYEHFWFKMQCRKIVHWVHHGQMVQSGVLLCNTQTHRIKTSFISNHRQAEDQAISYNGQQWNQVRYSRVDHRNPLYLIHRRYEQWSDNESITICILNSCTDCKWAANVADQKWIAVVADLEHSAVETGRGGWQPQETGSCDRSRVNKQNISHYFIYIITSVI